MTEPRDGVVIPYVRFVECLERRRRITVELTRQAQPETIDVDPVPVAQAVPIPPLTVKGQP